MTASCSLEELVDPVLQRPLLLGSRVLSCGVKVIATFWAVREGRSASHEIVHVVHEVLHALAARLADGGWVGRHSHAIWSLCSSANAHVHGEEDRGDEVELERPHYSPIIQGALGTFVFGQAVDNSSLLQLTALCAGRIQTRSQNNDSGIESIAACTPDAKYPLHCNHTYGA